MLFARIKYRVWQFLNELFPRYSQKDWEKALSFAPKQLTQILETHKPVEKAHIIRVFNEVCNSNEFSEERHDLFKTLAVIHDIGKTQKRLSLPMKAIKVLFGYDPANHCKTGAKLIQSKDCPPELVELVKKHHDSNTNDKDLATFIKIDDAN